MKKGIIAMISLLVIAGMIGGAVSKIDHHKNGKEVHLRTITRTGAVLCQSARFKDACVSTMGSASTATLKDPGAIIKVSFQVAKKALIQGISKSNTIQAAKNDPRSAQALEICREVMTYALNDLEKCVNNSGKLDNTPEINQFMEDLKVWLGGALTYQDVCFDAFEGAQDTEPGIKMRHFFNNSRELTSNALGMMDKAKELVTMLNIPSLFNKRGLYAGGPPGSFEDGSTPADLEQPDPPPDKITSDRSFYLFGGAAHRNLLEAESSDDSSPPDDSGSQAEAGTTPVWIKDAQRNLMAQPLTAIKPDAVVALDGSGQYKTVAEAIAKAPIGATTKPYIVYVKAGIYKESVQVNKKQNNVILIGDGSTKTIITFNKNFVDGIPTFKTATFGVLGEGFMARDVGFENSAGPEKHQAVAVRVTGDYAVFYNCQFDGFQDTLYSVRGRHFYRDCVVKGTIDFVFGDAQAVFQNCQMVVKKPMDNQRCAVTAQGRNDPNGPGATIFQNCSIVPDVDYTPEVQASSKAYLGRPWKPYSRTIIMQSFIDACIAPEGWEEWQGTKGLDTLYYAEFQNRGPGAAVDKRVTWKGIQKLSPDDVKQFYPETFYKGSMWVTPTGSPYTPEMMAGV